VSGDCGPPGVPLKHDVNPVSLIVPALVLVIAVAMGATAGARIVPPFATSAWLMPLFVSAVMALVSAALVISEIVLRRTVPAGRAPTAVEAAKSTPARVAGWIVLSAGYAIVTPQIGFEWATVVFLILALKVFSGASWRLTLPVAAVMALLVPLIFRHVFSALVP
jgi:hypothetical protein